VQILGLPRASRAPVDMNVAADCRFIHAQTRAEIKGYDADADMGALMHARRD
jgi:hypothetical protein